MNGHEVLRLVDAIHRDKNIDKQIVFEGVEQAILSAARKHFGEESELVVDVDRQGGEPSLHCDGRLIPPDELGEILGRISAQTAKQVMIQKIREAERDAWFDEYMAMKSHIVSGTVSRLEGGAALVALGKVEGILPRGEQIPGESHRVGERVRAIVLEVKKAGSRVKIILSRTHPDFVRRLFELEIPEVAEHIIEVRSLSREAGYRSKVAVSCIDSKIDAVGACVGVRGSRIKSIVDELAGERIDIVRWNDSLQVLVPNALSPAEVEDVILCPRLGKVIVLVQDDQLSLAIGKKGQNVRLASKLVGWDIQVMTQERLDELLENSVAAFASVPGITSELAEALVAEGFFTFDDLSVIEPDQLAELGGLSDEDVERIIEFADEQAARQEIEEQQAALEQRRAARLQRELVAAGVSVAPGPAAPAPPEAVPDEHEPELETDEASAEAEAEDAAAVESDVAPAEPAEDQPAESVAQQSVASDGDTAEEGEPSDTADRSEDSPQSLDGDEHEALGPARASATEE